MGEMSLLQDIRLALRLLWRTPSFTCIALLSIALSVGVVAVVFAAVKAVLIDPLPYARAGELVQIGADFETSDPSQSRGDWAFWNDAQEIIRRTRTLKSVGTYGNAIFDLAGDAATPPEALYGLRMSRASSHTWGHADAGSQHSCRRRRARPRECNDSELWIVEAPIQWGPERGWAHRQHRRPRLPCHRGDATGLQFSVAKAAAHTPSPYVEFWAAMQERPRGTTAGLGVVGRLRQGVSLHEAQQDLASIGAELKANPGHEPRSYTLEQASSRTEPWETQMNALRLLMAAALCFADRMRQCCEPDFSARVGPSA